MSRPRLPRAFFERDPRVVARALLGQQLVRVDDQKQRRSGLIVETEAYLGPHDKAAHSFANRRTARNESMWRQAGTAYVYFTYGMHHCLNVSTSGPGVPQAVLLRALEPTEGLDLMWPLRPKAKKPTDLCSGPAKLCAAFDVDLRHDRTDLPTASTLFIEQCRQRAHPKSRITTTARIGIGYAEQWTAKPLRFYLTDNAHVSGPRYP